MKLSRVTAPVRSCGARPAVLRAEKESASRETALQAPCQTPVPPFHGSRIQAGHRSVGQAPRLHNTSVITAETH
jgi:hypothetical protein